MVVDADLGAANAGEKRLGVIGASAFVGIGPFVIDPLRQKAIVQDIPMRRFIGMNRCIDAVFNVEMPQGQCELSTGSNRARAI